MKLSFWIGAPVLFAQAGVSAAWAAPGPPAPRPANVLLIIADDMGVDKIGSYAEDADPDYATDAVYLPDTPVLDEVAATGIRFTDAWASPTCSPSRAALFTGQYGLRTGIGQPAGMPDATWLESSLTTLAEVMSDAGYATGLFGKWHLGENELPADWEESDLWYDHAGETFEHTVHPMDHGWHRFIGTVNGTLSWNPIAGNGGYTDWIVLDSECDGCAAPEVTVHYREDYATDATVDDALTWIGEQTAPWMAVLSLHAPHTPLELPPEGCSYRAAEDAEPSEDIGIYEEMVECMDRRIGDLLEGIEDLDDTLVIFIGDNGTEADLAELDFDDGRGKATTFESGVRVPLIIADGKDIARQQEGWAFSLDWSRSPTVVAGWGRAESTPVHIVDLFATVAEVGRADASEGLDSVSLAPILRRESTDPRGPIYTESFETDGTGVAALRIGQWKLRATVWEAPAGLCRLGYELFNLNNDRFEQNDRSVVDAAILSTLKGRLDDLVATEPGSWLDVPDC